MANRLDGIACFQAKELLSITRNSPPGTAMQARRGRVDVGLVVPSHVDPNWFDEVWYGQPRKSHGLGAGIVRLAAALKSMRAGLSARAAQPVVVAALQGQWR